MVDVRGDVLRPPHGTTPAAVKANKNKYNNQTPLEMNMGLLLKIPNPPKFSDIS